MNFTRPGIAFTYIPSSVHTDYPSEYQGFDVGSCIHLESRVESREESRAYSFVESRIESKEESKVESSLESWLESLV